MNPSNTKFVSQLGPRIDVEVGETRLFMQGLPLPSLKAVVGGTGWLPVDWVLMKAEIEDGRPWIRPEWLLQPRRLLERSLAARGCGLAATASRRREERSAQTGNAAKQTQRQRRPRSGCVQQLPLSSTTAVTATNVNNPSLRYKMLVGPIRK